MRNSLGQFIKGNILTSVRTPMLEALGLNPIVLTSMGVCSGAVIKTT